MKKCFTTTLPAVMVCSALTLAIGVAHGETPVEDTPYFECCEEWRGNPTEYDRCVGDELNKHRAITAKNDELSLDRCEKYMSPFDRMKLEACAGEEINKFPGYGPEDLERYLAGEPWSWPENGPPWWEEDYVPVTTPEGDGEFYRWWEDDFYVTPQPSPVWGADPSGGRSEPAGDRTTSARSWAPPDL